MFAFLLLSGLVVGVMPHPASSMPSPDMAQVRAKLAKDVVQPKPEVEQPKPVVLWMFKSASCPACRQMLPVVRQLNKRGYTVKVADVAVPNNLRWFNSQGFRYVPSWAVLQGTRVLGTAVGPMSENGLAKWLDGFALQRPPKAGPLSNPVNWEAYKKGHHPRWVLSPGTCGMLGCTVHGGGRLLLLGYPYRKGE